MKKSGRKNDYFCSNTVNLEAADSNHSADTCTEFDSSRTIDELLRWAANESTAEIDFESIRLRAVESSRKSKMQRIRRIRALTAAGAAILLILFVFALTIGKINDCAKDPQVSAGLTPNAGATPEPFSDPMNLPSGYDSFQNAGTVADEAIKNTNMFPQNLPSEMHKKVDNDSLRISAEGFDANGNRLYYDCEVVDVAPYQLSVGQVGSFSDGVDIVYYWQITSGTCLRVRFFGFKQATAEMLFNQLSGQITGTSGKTAAVVAAPAPWIPSVISSGDSEPSEGDTLPVVSVPYIDNSPAETAPVYAAPIGTAPTVDIPFEQISDSGYDAIGEIPGFALNSESAAHRQRSTEVRSAGNPTGSVLPAREAAKLTAETTVQTPAKTLQTVVTVPKTPTGHSSMIRTVRSTKLRLTVPDFWANAGQACIRTRLSYFLFSELFSILFNKLNSEGIRA